MDHNGGTGGYGECNIKNSFYHAPVLYTGSTSSTMDDARDLIKRGAVHGTVLCTGFQSKGRGRFRNRKWDSPQGESLLFTIIIKKTELAFPVVRLPVMTGLALCLCCEEQFHFYPLIKWPNDIIFSRAKLAGILCEGEKDYVLCGVGMNCNQEVFPEALVKKAVSLYNITGKKREPLAVCEKVLMYLQRMFTPARPHRTWLHCMWPQRAGPQDNTWHKEVEKRLYRRGEKVKVLRQGKVDVFTAGCLYGIDTDGALLVMEEGAKRPVRVISGEVVFVE